MNSRKSLNKRKVPGFTRNLRCFARTTACAALALLLTQQAMANEEVRIFDQPPSAGELADILFPMTYRSIVFNNDAQEKPVSQDFGMLINFEYDSTVIVADSLPYLDSVGQMLNMEDIKDRSVVIEGHTDATGTETYNKHLSEQRAVAVKQYLVGVYDIDPGRLLVGGKGEQELLDRTDPEAAINRRVQFSAVN